MKKQEKNVTLTPPLVRKRRFIDNLRRDKVLILMVLPVIIHFLIFKYYPMYGNIIAFKNYSPVLGINGSHWVGLRYFKEFFNSPYFFRLIRNTLLISIYALAWGFPLPILFALMTNDLKNSGYKRVVQSLSYIPYFISTVVVCGMLYNFLSPSTGIINTFINKLGGESIHFLMEPKWFRTVFIASGVWQGFGWSSIIYIAALAGVNPELYEAATMDGANRLQKIWHVSLPCILPTIIITLILNIGSFMSVGYEKIILLYNPVTMETADVISSYVYRVGLVENNASLGAAVGLFNATINLVLVSLTNRIAKKLSDVSLW